MLVPFQPPRPLSALWLICHDMTQWLCNFSISNVLNFCYSSSLGRYWLLHSGNKTPQDLEMFRAYHLTNISFHLPICPAHNTWSSRTDTLQVPLYSIINVIHLSVVFMFWLISVCQAYLVHVWYGQWGQTCSLTLFGVTVIFFYLWYVPCPIWLQYLCPPGPCLLVPTEAIKPVLMAMKEKC